MDYLYFLAGCFVGSCISCVFTYTWLYFLVQDISKKYEIKVKPIDKTEVHDYSSMLDKIRSAKEYD